MGEQLGNLEEGEEGVLEIINEEVVATLLTTPIDVSVANIFPRVSLIFFQSEFNNGGLPLEENGEIFILNITNLVDSINVDNSLVISFWFLKYTPDKEEKFYTYEKLK